jgi:hypothetical protein
MKPWGVSISFVYIFPPILCGNRERLAGVQGGGNEPPGRRTMRRNPRQGCLHDLTVPGYALGLHSTIRAAARGGSPERVPAQVSKYATPLIRSDILL